MELLGKEVIQAFRCSCVLRVSPLDRWFIQRNIEKRTLVPCGSCRGLVLIDTKGGIWPCSRFSSHPTEYYRFGSLYEEIDEKKRQPFLNDFSPDKFYPECEDCMAIKICGGGCLVENLEVTGDMHVQSPNDCEINRIHARVGTKVHDILYGEKNPLFMKTYYAKEWKETEQKHSHDTQSKEPCVSRNTCQSE